MRFKQFFLP